MAIGAFKLISGDKIRNVEDRSYVLKRFVSAKQPGQSDEDFLRNTHFAITRTGRIDKRFKECLPSNVSPAVEAVPVPTGGVFDRFAIEQSISLKNMTGSDISLLAKALDRYVKFAGPMEVQNATHLHTLMQNVANKVRL